MDVVTLNRRYNWLWSQTERLVEKFLKHHLDETPETAKKPVVPSPRDIHAIARSLKLIYDGRRAILLDREHPLDAHIEEEAANRAFEEVSRRIRAMIEQGEIDDPDDNPDADEPDHDYTEPDDYPDDTEPHVHNPLPQPPTIQQPPHNPNPETPTGPTEETPSPETRNPTPETPPAPSEETPSPDT